MKTALFVDTENLYYELNKRFQKRLHYVRFLSNLKTNYHYDISIRYAYGNQESTIIHKFINHLNLLGFQTNFKFGADWHVPLILHAVSIVEKVDCVVLATSNPVYAPLIPWLNAHGVKVHIVACNISRALSDVALCSEITKDLLESPEVNPPNWEGAGA